MRETHGNGCVDVSRSRKPVEIEKFHRGSEPIQTRFLHDTNTEIPNRQPNRRSEKKNIIRCSLVPSQPPEYHGAFAWVEKRKRATDPERFESLCDA